MILILILLVEFILSNFIADVNAADFRSDQYASANNPSICDR